MTPAGRNKATGLALFAVVAGMLVLAAASVPLYRMFCKASGFAGTTQRAEQAPGVAEGAPIVTVQFNGDVAKNLPWAFAPEQREVKVRLGEPVTAVFRATNLSQATITGTATFNVTPARVGPYFDKIQCFCFDEQTLAPGQTVEMPVTFFVDPEMLKDVNAKDVDLVTLSYTFFASKAGKKANAVGGDSGSSNIKRSS